MASPPPNISKKEKSNFCDWIFSNPRASQLWEEFLAASGSATGPPSSAPAAMPPPAAISQEKAVSRDPRVRAASARSRSLSRSRSPVRPALKTAPPASKSTSSTELDSALSPSDDGFITVTKGRKRPAAISSPPPAKTACSSAAPAAPAAVSQLPSSPAFDVEMPLSGKSTKSERAPPPLFIQDKEKWTRIRPLLSTHKVDWTSIRAVKTGIRVQVSTSENHRVLTRLLRHENVGFHTYALEEEKVLRVVLRGVPKEILPEFILEDLKAQGFPVREVHRLYSGRTKTAFDLVLVILDRSPEGKAIFNVKKVVDLSGIVVETPRRGGSPSQCHRCQLYGHAARFCFARPRCVKCLGDHGTTECSRTPQTPEPPGCVLCGKLGHTANYRGCPNAPRNAKGPSRRGPSRPAPLSRSQGIFPVAPAATTRPAAFSVAPPPAVSAWSRPLAMTQAMTAPAAARNAPVQTKLLPPRSVAPKPTPLIPPTGPSGPAQPSLMEDLTLIRQWLSVIDVTAVRALAHKLRSASTPEERFLALAQHDAILDAVVRCPLGSLGRN